MRLSKAKAKIVKDGLFAALSEEKYLHPDALPNSFGDIWINDAQKRSYLRRMADKGIIYLAYHSRGWYAWYTYKKPSGDFPF